MPPPRPSITELFLEFWKDSWHTKLAITVIILWLVTLLNPFDIFPLDLPKVESKTLIGIGVIALLATGAASVLAAVYLFLFVTALWEHYPETGWIAVGIIIGIFLMTINWNA